MTVLFKFSAKQDEASPDAVTHVTGPNQSQGVGVVQGNGGEGGQRRPITAHVRASDERGKAGEEENAVSSTTPRDASGPEDGNGYANLEDAENGGDVKEIGRKTAEALKGVPDEDSGFDYAAGCRRCRREIEVSVMHNRRVRSMLADAQERARVLKTHKKLILRRLYKHLNKGEPSVAGDMEPADASSPPPHNADDAQDTAHAHAHERSEGGDPGGDNDEDDEEEAEETVHSIPLPMRVGALEVFDLGRIVTSRPGYHTERHVFPAGYRVQRVHTSLANREGECIYTLTVHDDGSPSPQFHITGNEHEGFMASADSAVTVVNGLNEAVGTSDKLVTYTAALDFFGLSNPVIMEMIRTLPGIESCWKLRKYR